MLTLTISVFPCTEISLCVSVSSTTAQEELLNGAVGESVTFPTRVPVSGFIGYEGSVIGQVFNKQTDTESDEKFRDRLHWNSQSGVFTLSDLRTADSGLYTVESTKEEKRKQDYQLMVYGECVSQCIMKWISTDQQLLLSGLSFYSVVPDKVSAPQLIKLNTSPPESELCSVLCSVRNVRGLNLSWFKGGVLLNHTSSSSTDDTLSLPLDIQQPDNDPYSCVASNPVSKQTTTVDITLHCFYYPGMKLDTDMSFRLLNCTG